MKTTERYVWVIAHVDTATVGRIERDLQKSNQYLGVEARVPMVKILIKKFKGKEHFDHVPLLFNYGFFKIPLLYAMNQDLLNQVKEDITCISHFVKDPARSMVRKSKYANRDENTPKTKRQKYLDKIRGVICATATKREVMEMIRISEEESIHSAENIDRLHVGDIVTLMGYPFDGMQARVDLIDKKAKKVTVTLKLSVGDEDEEEEATFQGNPVVVSFDSVLYSIYRGSYHENYNYKKSANEYQSKNQRADDYEDE
jgi:transcription antitermination factor NusG